MILFFRKSQKRRIVKRILVFASKIPSTYAKKNGINQYKNSLFFNIYIINIKWYNSIPKLTLFENNYRNVETPVKNV